MNNHQKKPTLKEINAYKKQLNWGESPAIFHMAMTSVSDIDGILSHGFDSAYRRLLNKNTWNLNFLGSYRDNKGNILVNNKPKIALEHVFTEQHYELHCFPIVGDEKINTVMQKHPECPFETWLPNTMKMLFRVSSLVSFMTYSIQGGDDADLALIKFTFYKVEELIDTLKDSFEITEIGGYNIAEFYREIDRRRGQNHQDPLNNSAE